MDSPIPPDPYVALGVTREADADAIKKAYRKLALKLHPDKCTDESQKAARTDEFTKIQQAYDLIGDDDRRRVYDAQARLEELRRQKMEMRNSAPPSSQRPDGKYNVRMSAPRDAAYSSYATPPRASYEQPPRPRYYEEDYEPARGSTRKVPVADEYSSYSKRPAASSREEKREKPRATEPREEERRRDAKRREAEVRESRSSKYARDEYDEDRRRREYDDMRRKADAYAGGHSSSTERITEERLRDAQRHMDRQRPSMPRRESTRQVPTYREPEVRRSAAPPKEKERARDSRRTSPSKDERRRTAENVDASYERRVPNLATHASAPPVVETMPHPTPRSYTTPNMEAKKKAKDSSPPPPQPAFTRSTSQPAESMPAASSSSKRKEPKARAAGDDSGYASNAGTPGYSTTHTYGDERAAPHVSYTNGHRTVLREPSASNRRSDPSPARPSKGAVKMKGLDPKSVKRTQYSYAPGPGATPIVVEPATVPLTGSTAAKPSSRRPSREREYEYDQRPRPQYFGENGNGTVDPRFEHVPYDEYARQQRAQADVKYPAPRQRSFDKPSFTRSASAYVY